MNLIPNKSHASLSYQLAQGKISVTELTGLSAETQVLIFILKFLETLNRL